MTYVIEGFYPELENLNYVRTFKDLKLRYDQHKDKPLDNQGNRSRISSDGSNSCGNTPALYRTRTSSDRYRSSQALNNNNQDRLDFDKEDDTWIQEDDNEIEARIDNSPNSAAVGGFMLASSFSSSSFKFEYFLPYVPSKLGNISSNHSFHISLIHSRSLL